FGLPDTDVNQLVFTGRYASLLEEQATALVAARGEDAARHVGEHVTLVFSSSFAAGSRYEVRAWQRRVGDRTLTVATVHAVRPDGVEDRPAVTGRLLGRVLGPENARVPR
ncbi:MAG: hotdog domain-containing protein, partial [Catenulispora sp.]